MNDTTDDYIREGDIILVDSKDDNSISEVQITDISPSGDYIEISFDADGFNKMWVHSNRHIETLISAKDVDDADEDEWEEIVDADDEDLIGDEWKTSEQESTSDIIARIRSRNIDTSKPSVESDVIQMDEFTKFDERNKRK